MSWIRHVRNAFRRERLLEELDEELTSHIEEAIEQGRSPEEARRAFGGMLRHREASRDIKVLPWLESLVSDLVFGWRQLLKHRAANIGAILSLALAMGAITGVFRLVEAVLLRPLPVASPELLQYIETGEHDPETGKELMRDDFSYPRFREYRTLLRDDADLLLVGYSTQVDVTFGGDDDVEKLYRQFVSGNLFSVFGLQPAIGRLLLPDDDVKPGAHAVAVLSFGYWTRRFGRDAGVIGKTFRYGKEIYEIVGVAPKGFVGTEPGAMTDAFIPAMMHTEALERPGWSWFFIWLRPKAGVALEQIRQKLQTSILRDREEQLKYWISGSPQEYIDAFLSVRVLFSPAANGASHLQKQYRQPLVILSVLAGLVLLIACANVTNLRTAQAIAREREIALRVSIGAGRRRLVQMMLIESALAAALASVSSILFAWFSVPLVVSMLTPPESPVRLVLDAEWRIIAFILGVTIAVTFFCGLAPAVRVSSVRPLHATRGGVTPFSHRRLMNSLLAVQVSFCVLVLFVGGLFVTTFKRLSNHRLGFSPENVVVIETETTTGRHPPEIWAQVANHLRETPEVQSVALARWALMSGYRWTPDFRKNGEVAQGAFLALDVSAGFFDTMRIGWIDGRDFRIGDHGPLNEMGKPISGVGIVNEAFARYFFDGQNPVGRSAEIFIGQDVVARVEIIGYVRDASYRNLRDPILPTLYVPIGDSSNSTFLVRTAAESSSIPGLLRSEISKARSDFRVQNVTTQSALIRRHSITERLLAALSFFFGATALVLAGMGLYSVLSYAIVRRRREIGIRRALGAQSLDVVWRVMAECAGPLCLGMAIGVGTGLACERYFRWLLFDVRATELAMLVTPAAALIVVALIAALQPAAQAVRIDPAETLRAE